MNSFYDETIQFQNDVIIELQLYQSFKHNSFGIRLVVI